MNDETTKSIDCVQMMRQIRDHVSREIAGMENEQIIQWLRSRQYADPFLQMLADKAIKRGAEMETKQQGNNVVNTTVMLSNE